MSSDSRKESDDGKETNATALVKQPAPGTNIDLQTFYMRHMMGCRLRNENRDKIPILLYWHPAVDCCASVCGIPPQAMAAAATLSGAAQSTTSSFVQRIKQTLWWTAGSAGGSASSDLPAGGEQAIMKLLVPGAQPLEYITMHMHAALLQCANEHVRRVHGANFDAAWAARRNSLVEHCPSWDARDRETVLGFYLTRFRVPYAVNPQWRTDRIDAQYVGDDFMLRLFVSIEFRRAFRDKLIEQQRQVNYLWECQQRQRQQAQMVEQQRAEQRAERVVERVEQQRAERVERAEQRVERVERAERVEQQRAERVVERVEQQQRAERVAVAETATTKTSATEQEKANAEPVAGNGHEMQQVTTQAASFLDRATSNVTSGTLALVGGTLATTQSLVGGTLATTQSLVGGTLATTQSLVGGAARATSAGGRIMGNAVGSLVSSTTAAVLGKP